jgi:hypothetical protein
MDKDKGGNIVVGLEDNKIVGYWNTARKTQRHQLSLSRYNP